MGCAWALRQALPDHFSYGLELVTSANITTVAMRKLLAIAQIPSRLVNVNFMLEQQRITQMETSVELNQRVGSILDQDELLAEMAEIIRAHQNTSRPSSLSGLAESGRWCASKSGGRTTNP